MTVKPLSGFGTLGYGGGGENLANVSSPISYDYLEALAIQQFQSSCGTSTCFTSESGNIYSKPKERKSMFKQVTDYVDNHIDVIVTLAFVILIDRFLFKGALKNRIQTAIEGVIKKVEDRIGEK
jgi:hypothetical protein